MKPNGPTKNNLIQGGQSASTTQLVGCLGCHLLYCIRPKHANRDKWCLGPLLVSNLLRCSSCGATASHDMSECYGAQVGTDAPSVKATNLCRESHPVVSHIRKLANNYFHKLISSTSKNSTNEVFPSATKPVPINVFRLQQAPHNSSKH